MRKHITWTTAAALTGLLALTACGEETAGDKLDNAIEDAQDAADDAQDKAEEAVDAAKEEADKLKKALDDK